MIHRFLHWLLILALMLCMAACEPAAAQPTATLAPTIAPAITSDAVQPLVLVLPDYSGQKTLIAANRHYSDAVKQKGWNVEFYTVQQQYSSGNESCYVQYIAKQLSSGAARADGFLCAQYLSGAGNEALQQAKNNGQIYDCVSAAPQAAPEYWAKYQEQITAGKYGLALAGQLTAVRTNDLVLVVRKDILPRADLDITGYNGLRALFTRLEQAQVEHAYVQANPQQLLSLWTRQQGYLQLFPNAGIYARMDDPDAKLVMLEDIPGFREFCQDLSALKLHDLLQDPPTISPSSDDAAKQSQSSNDLGPAAALDSSYNLLYVHNAVDPSWIGYTAFPMVTAGPYADDVGGALGADSFSSRPLVQELIIPARSRRAADAMAFIQWIYADRRNADAVMYGQEGVDYTLLGERVAMLDDAALQDSPSMPFWQSWPGEYIFPMSAQRRICADAPDNAQALLLAPSYKPLAAPWLACLQDTGTWHRLTTRSSIDDRELFTNQFWDDFRRYHGGGMDADAYIQTLRLGATDSAMQIYHDALTEARTIAQP